MQRSILFYLMTAAKIIRLGGWLFCCVVQTSAIAQQDQPTISTQSYADWYVRCESTEAVDKSCVMSQQVLTKSGERQLLQINIAKVEQGILMTAIFPLGIYLPAGAYLQVDEFEKSHFTFEFCTARGCFVNQLLDHGLVQLMRKKQSAKFTIEVANGSPIHIPMSISGFLGAFAEL